MIDLKKKVYMVPGVAVEHLSQMVELQARKIPQPMIEFVRMFLKRFSKVFGVEFLIALPQRGFLLADDGRIRNTLRFLKQSGIATDFFLRKKEFSDEPNFFEATILIQGRQRMGHSGYGKSLVSIDEAWQSAIGEAIERWSLEHYVPSASSIETVSVAELSTRFGLTLEKVTGLSPEFRMQGTEQHSFAITPETLLECIEVEELTSTQKTKAPLQWFSFPYARESTDSRREPVIFPLTSSGAASGTSVSDAIYRGVLELIERDAFMIHWMGGVLPHRIALERMHTESALKLKRMAERYALDFHFLYLKTDFPVHVVMAVVLDRSGVGPAVVADTAGGTSLEKCMERAVLGALGLRPYIRRNMTSQKDLSHREKGTLTLENRAFWWADIERIATIEPFLQGTTLSEEEILKMDTEYRLTDLGVLIHALREKGFQAYVKTICPPEVTRETGFTTVVVKIPQLQPMHLNEEELCNFGPRIHDVPKMLHLEVGVDFSKIPHPCA